eukprot:scaffold16970_cov101-Isochrysis_galbana.AAC.2
MLRAIRYCHLNGVVHRDIKLDNFIYEALGEDAELKLIDFGFACEVRMPGEGRGEVGARADVVKGRLRVARLRRVVEANAAQRGR